jgi:hypothetical protein
LEGKEDQAGDGDECSHSIEFTDFNDIDVIIEENSRENREQQENEEDDEEEEEECLSGEHENLFFDEEYVTDEDSEGEEQDGFHLFDAYSNTETHEEENEEFNESAIKTYQALIMILQFVVTAKLSKEQMKSFFSLLLEILPPESQLKIYLSLRKLQKRFSLGMPFQTIFYCKDCSMWKYDNNNTHQHCNCNKTLTH